MRPARRVPPRCRRHRAAQSPGCRGRRSATWSRGRPLSRADRPARRAARHRRPRRLRLDDRAADRADGRRPLRPAAGLRSRPDPGAFPWVTTRRFAFIAARRGRPRARAGRPFPVDLLGREDGALAADPLRAVDAPDDAAEAGPDGAAHVLLHGDLEEGLATRLGRTRSHGLPRPALPAELRHAEAVAPTGGQAGQHPQHRERAAGEGLVGPGLVLEDEVGHEAAVADAPVVGGHDVLDLVGEERARVDLRCVAAAVQEHDLAPFAERLVGEQPHVGDAEAAGHEQQVPAAGVDLEPLAERPEHVEPVARPHPCQPGRPPPDLPEVDRDRAGRRVGRVDGERTPQDEPGPVAGSDVDELTGPDPRGKRRRVVVLQPLAGQDLPALEELRGDELHRPGVCAGRPSQRSLTSSVSSSSLPSSSSTSSSSSASSSSGATDG